MEMTGEGESVLEVEVEGGARNCNDARLVLVEVEGAPVNVARDMSSRAASTSNLDSSTPPPLPSSLKNSLGGEVDRGGVSTE